MKVILFSFGITNVIIISPGKVINSISINMKIIKYFIDIKHILYIQGLVVYISECPTQDFIVLVAV